MFGTPGMWNLLSFRFRRMKKDREGTSKIYMTGTNIKSTSKVAVYCLINHRGPTKSCVTNMNKTLIKRNMNKTS
jgi:hypothetical protein